MLNPLKPFISSKDLELSSDALSKEDLSGFRIIDVREVFERSGNPASVQELEQISCRNISALEALPKEERYLFFCAHGVRSLQVAKHLKKKGFEEVFSLKGGYRAMVTLMGDA